MNFDKIFALSSGAGKSGIAVVRLSGDDLLSDFKKIINSDKKIIPRHFYMAKIFDDKKELIDNCMAVYFENPKSFTGTDMIEIFPHGSRAVLDKLFDYLSGMGYRIATPGEFSKRAFYNNKMDLAEVDGLIALLDAKTDKQRQSALKSMMGSDSEVYNGWRSQMVDLAAYSAAMLDYPIDELPQNIHDKIIRGVQQLHDEISNALSGYAASNALTSGFNIVLSGDVNVGKSSLFNQLVGTDRAIVSDVKGTTRDVISCEINIGGYLVNLFDTAGIRESDDEIEKIGIQKSFESMSTANLVLRVYANEIRDIAPPAENELIIFNKCDSRQIKTNDKNSICVSAKTGENIDELLKLITNKITNLIGNNENALTINHRTKQLLEKTVAELSIALKKSDLPDLFADHINGASDNIGKILGTIHVSEIADATFNMLCLGK